MSDLAGIVERDAALPVDRECICDAASFWVPDRGCVICGHDRDVHGSDPSCCAVRSPYRPSPSESDRRALLALLREAREALHRLSLPDEMNGMGDVDDMPSGPGRGELESRMSFARHADSRLAALGETR